MSSEALVEDVRKLLQVLSHDFGRVMVQQTPGTLVSYDLAERLSGLPRGALRRKIYQMDWHDVIGKYIGIADIRGGMTHSWKIRGVAPALERIRKQKLEPFMKKRKIHASERGIGIKSVPDIYMLTNFEEFNLYLNFTSRRLRVLQDIGFITKRMDFEAAIRQLAKKKQFTGYSITAIRESAKPAIELVDELIKLIAYDQTRLLPYKSVLGTEFTEYLERECREQPPSAWEEKRPFVYRNLAKAASALLNGRSMLFEMEQHHGREELSSIMEGRLSSLRMITKFRTSNTPLIHKQYAKWHHLAPLSSGELFELVLKGQGPDVWELGLSGLLNGPDWQVILDHYLLFGWYPSGSVLLLSRDRTIPRTPYIVRDRFDAAEYDRLTTLALKKQRVYQDAKIIGRVPDYETLLKDYVSTNREPPAGPNLIAAPNPIPLFLEKRGWKIVDSHLMEGIGLTNPIITSTVFLAKIDRFRDEPELLTYLSENAEHILNRFTEDPYSDWLTFDSRPYHDQYLKLVGFTRSEAEELTRSRIS
jgi:hypothetical protein